MPEIKILNEQKQEISSFDLGIVEAGKITDKIFFVKNEMPFELNVKIIVSGQDVKLNDDEFKISANSTRDIILSVSPSKKALKPIKAEIKFEVNYVVK
jgi:hypothetical protein